MGPRLSALSVELGWGTLTLPKTFDMSEIHLHAPPGSVSTQLLIVSASEEIPPEVVVLKDGNDTKDSNRSA